MAKIQTLSESQQASSKAGGSPLTSQLGVLQPQFLTLIITLLIIMGISVWVFLMVRKADPKKAPKGVVFAAEQYINFFDTTFQSATGGRLNPTGPYLFSLLTFLLVGNLLALVGLPALATAYSIPLTFAFITWSMIYVVGWIFHGAKSLKRFLNPLELIGQFIPLLSLSIRMFGNIISGSVIIYLLYAVSAYLFKLITANPVQNFVLGPLITPLFHLYLDAFGALIQAYVFTLLTMMYWVNETSEHTRKQEKMLKKQSQQEKNQIKQIKHI